MTEHQIALQKEYQTLDDFIKEQNNFYLHFLGDSNLVSGHYRSMPHFQRFQEQNPKMAIDVTKATVQALRVKTRPELPYEQLWEAYKLMSKLVFVDDPYVMRDNQPDNVFLCK